MPDITDDPFAAQNPQPQNDVNPPREDILKLVGLSKETAEKIAREESQNMLRLRASFASGQAIYDQLKAGHEINVVTIGSGQFPISPQEKPVDFVKECIARSQEIKPQPPQDELKNFFHGFGEKALLDTPKELAAAAIAFNFVAGDNLRESEELLKKLTDAAKSDDEKYQLARALEEVIPAESPLPVAPQNQTDQLYDQLQTQSQPQLEPALDEPEKIKKPYLPFASYKPPVNITNGQSHESNDSQQVGTNNQALNSISGEPNLRPVPPRPPASLAQDIG
jgi:hypothetical protein